MHFPPALSVLALAMAAACSDLPTLPEPATPPAPNAARVNEPENPAIEDVLDRILPGLEERAAAAELRLALTAATPDPRAVEMVLSRLEAQQATEADAVAIRLALATR